MSKIIAYRCDTTGKVFEHKVKYQSHLKKLAADRRARAKHDAFEKARKQVFIDMRNTVRSYKELEAYIKANWQHFAMNATINSNHQWGLFTRKHKNLVHPDLKFFSIKSFRWSDEVSNSHRCPIGGVTNWGGRGDPMPDGSPRPCNYPGWLCQIEYNTVSESRVSYGNSAWEDTGINTGTGGQATNYYFAVELFASDWPAMAAARESEAARAWAILNNDTRKIDEVVADMYSTT
jgi:hypothetical protein